MDAQWNDGFHHALRALLAGENSGYYADYGSFRQVAKAYRDGFVYTGQYSRVRRRRHGSSTAGLAGRQFVVFSQNHDQVGNRMLGERLAALTDFETLKLIAAAVVLSPFTPLLFMGEEYGEIAPFQYFVSHSDPGLVEAVHFGRREEFAAFAWQGECPDPQDEATFLRSKISPELRLSGRHAALNAFYTELLRLRRTVPALGELTVLEDEQVLAFHRRCGHQEALVVMNFSDASTQSRDREGAGPWRLALDSSSARWNGPGPDSPAELDCNTYFTVAARSVLVYLRNSSET